MSSLVNVVLIVRFTLCNRAELRFAVRTTCKQLNSIRKRSHYIRLLLICYQTHAEQIITVLTVRWFHSHDFQEYFKGCASPWRHFRANRGHFSF